MISRKTYQIRKTIKLRECIFSLRTVQTGGKKNLMQNVSKSRSVKTLNSLLFSRLLKPKKSKTQRCLFQNVAGSSKKMLQRPNIRLYVANLLCTCTLLHPVVAILPAYLRMAEERVSY